MKKLEKRKCVKNATQFKIIFNDSFDVKIKEKTFDKIKSMEQWISRQDVFSVFPLNRYALIENKWYSFAVIGNRYFTINELEVIINDLKLTI